MPSQRHDAAKDLAADSPQTIARLVRMKADVEIRPDAPFRMEKNEVNDRPSSDLFPDIVFSQGFPSHPSGIFVVEVQHEKDEGKRRQIPRYAAALWLFHRCTTIIAVFSPDQAAADYYSQPIATELPGYTFPPVAVGPKDIPIVEDVDTAAADPALAALSVMAHGYAPGVLDTFMEGLTRLEADDSSKYYEYAYRLASQQVKNNLEAAMSSSAWPVYSPFAKEHFSKGREEGVIEERASAILDILHARGKAVDDGVRDRITACTDGEKLRTWLFAAATVEKTEDIFEA
ncbi:hypothetical protein [Nocardiopsis suaedae]|uniref:DUF4365 domain-containing protein n=1 Tax=Nocardiopsis suaedae TaxID=3018444 RepID=A0ABT4TTA3_9ACTN|nr:hypothetical protein [Nocardiopsis suaedae]MDA2807930.1 hypothetical protein [Nocardiopsis suaedae]